MPVCELRGSAIHIAGTAMCNTSALCCTPVVTQAAEEAEAARLAEEARQAEEAARLAAEEARRVELTRVSATASVRTLYAAVLTCSCHQAGCNRRADANVALAGGSTRHN